MKIKQENMNNPPNKLYCLIREDIENQIDIKIRNNVLGKIWKNTSSRIEDKIRSEVFGKIFEEVKTKARGEIRITLESRTI